MWQRFWHFVRPTLTRTQFARLLQQELQGLRPDSDVVFDEPEFRLSSASITLNLTNFYSTYVAARRWDRAAVLANYRKFSALKCSMPETWEQARRAALPKVRERGFFWRLDGQPVDLAAELGGDLQATVVLDSEENCVYLIRSQLDKWAISREEAVQTAKDNLLGRSMHEFLSDGSGLYRSPWRDTYDVSRLLLSQLFAGLAVKGKRLVVAPHRDCLLVGGSEDEDALWQALQEELGQPYPLSPRPLLWRPDGWDAYEPRHEAWRKCLRSFEAEVYNDQAELLNDSMEEDIFVASVMTISRGRESTDVTNWAYQCDTLLPQARWVMIQVDPTPKSEPRCYRWEDFRRGFAAFLQEEPGLVPRRYRTKGFPTPTDLDAVAWVDTGKLLSSAAP